MFVIKLADSSDIYNSIWSYSLHLLSLKLLLQVAPDISSDNFDIKNHKNSNENLKIFIKYK